MELDFLDDIFWGNSIGQLFLFVAILILGFLFKRWISKLLNKLLYQVCKRIHADTDFSVFSELLLKPVEFLMLLSIIYLSINQLDFPFNEVIFRRASLVGGQERILEWRL